MSSHRKTETKHQRLIAMLNGEIAALRNEVTALKTNARVNAENGRKFRDLVEGSNQGIMIHRNFNFIFMNSMFAEIYGYASIGEIMDKTSILNLVPEKTKQLFQQHLTNRLAGKPAASFYEYEGTKKDGTSIWLENVVRLIEWDGKPAVQTTVIDVTERKRAQLELQVSEARFRTYASIGADWMWETDDEDRFVYVSNSFFEKQGILPVDVIGKSRRSWISALDLTDQPEVWARHFKSVKSCEAFYDVEYRMISSNGSVRHITMSGVPITHKNGQFCGYRGTSRDITERFETERLKAEFVSTVSHELRTPLTTIKGSLGLIKGGAFGKIPEQIEPVVALADANTTRLVALVNDLLDLELMRKNDLSFHMSSVNMGNLIGDSVKLRQVDADDAGISLVICHNHSDLFVWGDQRRLQQVLLNLLSNAIKFSPSGSVVDIRLSKGKSRCRVQVTDRGVGISKHLHKTIFKQFTQADASDTRINGGTGIGLSIAKSIIEFHRGRIDFISNPGTGTEFFFELPLRGI